MERYFKISESELLNLIARDWQLCHMETAGVDNWDSGGMISESFAEACHEAGLTGDPDDYSYEDLARTVLSDYPEVEP